MQQVSIIPVIYLAIRFLVDAADEAIKSKGREWKPIAALIIGLAIAFGGPLDVMALLVPDFEVAAWVGRGVTGIALAGGASFLNDVVKRLNV